MGIELRLLLFCGATCAPVTAQSVLQGHVGDHGNARLGEFASSAGDVDMDGVGDYLLVAPGFVGPAGEAGFLRVYSGANHTLLRELLGGTAGGGILGGAGVGDLDGDGHDDVAYGFQSDANGAGCNGVRVISSASGAQLHEFLGPAAGSKFDRVSPVGDVNADGVPDLSIGAPGTGSQSRGMVCVYSGSDGSLLYTFQDSTQTAKLGNWNRDMEVGDLDGDGHDEVFVVAHRNNAGGTNAGAAWVYSGRTGAVLYSYTGSSSWDRLGTSGCGLGDINMDGVPDFAVGAERQGGGRAFVYSGADGSLLYQLSGTGQFGAVARAGDLNGDGHADFFIGAPTWGPSWQELGRLNAYSGADGSALFEIPGPSYGSFGHFGSPCATVGDIDGDGLDDFITAAPGYDSSERGAAWIISPRGNSADCNGNGMPDAMEIGFGLADDRNGNLVLDGCEPVGTVYCTPNSANSTGGPGRILGLGSDLSSDQALYLHAYGLPQGQSGYFLMGERQDQVLFPGGNEGILCLGGKLGRFVGQIQQSDASGTFGIHVDLTALPLGTPHAVQAGETWHFQAWYRDVQAISTSNLTDALSVSFQ